MADTEMSTKVEWISTTDALADFCAHVKGQAFVAIDTEFHREKTYYAELALVQVATPQRVACIDPLAKVEGGVLDLAPLDDILLDPATVKVLHASRQDLEIFFMRTKQVPAPIFDTQVAAALLGLGDQIGYGALVQRVCDIPLAKLHGRTDWMRRPLDPSVIEYAAHDVTHLRDVYLSLDKELRDRERRDWLEEEQEQLAATETYAPDLDEVWQKVKGSGRLQPKESVVARALGRFRELEAQSKDRPRRRVISDEAIIDLSRQRPTEAGKLDRLRSLDDGTRKRYGKAIVGLIAEAVASPRESWPASRDRGRQAPTDPALAEALSTVVEVCARTHDISSKSLCTRDDLENAANGKRDLALFRGWRGRLAGDSVESFLAGKTALIVQDGVLTVKES